MRHKAITLALRFGLLGALLLAAGAGKKWTG
jgi:hypothetical protein